MNDANRNVTAEAVRPGRTVRLAFALTLLFSALTGFAQMPIFKRYYIADIPGLGWLAEFYVTYRLHYISATAFIAIAAYLVVGYLLHGRHRARLTVTGAVRAGFLFLILATGILLVFRNFPGYRYSPELIVVLNFSHLALVVAFLATALAVGLGKKKWTIPR